MTKTWTRGYHEFKTIEGVAENGIVYHKVYRDERLRFVSIGSWHIYTDDPAYINVATASFSTALDDDVRRLGM